MKKNFANHHIARGEIFDELASRKYLTGKLLTVSSFET